MLDLTEQTYCTHRGSQLCSAVCVLIGSPLGSPLSTIGSQRQEREGEWEIAMCAFSQMFYVGTYN